MAVSFPNIDPVAIALGPLKIRWYALAYISGFLLGWWYALRLVVFSAKKDSDKSDEIYTKQDIDDFLPWTIFGVILGGRIGYALFYQFEYYIENPLVLLKVWQGGMSFHGGVLGVIVAILLFAKRRGKSAFSLADIVCCCVPIGLFFGRIANFVNGELYGRPTESAFGVIFPMSDGLPRHPSQLYEALLEGFVLFFMLAAFYRIDFFRRIQGAVAALFLILYGAFRFAIEFFREPDAFIGLIGNTFSMGQLLCVPMVCLGGALFVYRYKCAQRAMRST